MQLKRFITKVKKTKIIFIASAVVVLLLAVTFITKAFSQEYSGYLETQIIDGLEFINAKEVIENNIYTLKVEVINTSNSEYNLNTIDVIIKDKDNNELETLSGYIGNKLDSGEKKILSVSVDKELKDIGNISYKINK